jgi:hypothetical protein
MVLFFNRLKMASTGNLKGIEVPANGIEEIDFDDQIPVDEEFAKLYGRANLLQYCKVTLFERDAFIGKKAGKVNAPPQVRAKIIIFKANRFLRACIQSQYVLIYVHTFLSM